MWEDEKDNFETNDTNDFDLNDLENSVSEETQPICWRSDMPSVSDADYKSESEENTVAEQPPKSRKGIGLTALFVCIALFCGIVTGAAIPYFVKTNPEESGSARSGVVIAQNKGNGAQQTAYSGVLSGEELSTQEIAATVGPAVVGVENLARIRSRGSDSTMAQGSGSGVVIAADGYIVTNYHVIENASAINVIMNSGERYTAQIIGTDADTDLAVIKIEATGLAHAVFGESSSVMVGDRAIAIGNPLGTELMGTVTQGIISAVNRTVEIDNKTMTLLQTDAAINSGNSGGALLNGRGELIGINSAKMAASGVEGLGFAIPSNTVLDVVTDLIDYGYVRGKLTVGIGGTNITERMAEYYDMPVGFYVQEVYAGSGAAAAGIKTGDIVVKCDGKVVKTIDDINAAKQTHSAGESMSMEIVRNGKNITVQVVLQEEKPDTAR